MWGEGIWGLLSFDMNQEYLYVLKFIHEEGGWLEIAFCLLKYGVFNGG